jgi:hypothetical protein
MINKIKDSLRRRLVEIGREEIDGISGTWQAPEQALYRAV